MPLTSGRLSISLNNLLRSYQYANLTLNKHSNYLLHCLHVKVHNICDGLQLSVFGALLKNLLKRCADGNKQKVRY